MEKSLKRKVQIWIFRNAPKTNAGVEVLLLKTHAERGLFWQPVTGGADEGESFEEAACREVQEETSISEGKLMDLNFEFEFEKNRLNFHEKSFGFQCSPDSSIRIDSKEHIEYQWCEPSSALSQVRFDSNRLALQNLIQRLREGND